MGWFLLSSGELQYVHVWGQPACLPQVELSQDVTNDNAFARYRSTSPLDEKYDPNIMYDTLPDAMYKNICSLCGKTFNEWRESEFQGT